jgi:SAM-dependent methyltransferase
MRCLHWFGRASLTAALLAFVALAAVADDQTDKDKDKQVKDKDKAAVKDKKDKSDVEKKDKGKKEERDLDVVFVPTPPEVVDKMLEVAKVTDKDVVYDLGCGDGRIVIAAAKKYKCKAVGVDLDPARIKECEAAKAKEDKDVQKLITFEKKDLFEVDLGQATVVTLYLLPDLNEKLIGQLKKLPKGARVVSHAFPIKGATPDKGYPVTVKKGGLDYDVYLWTAPLNLQKDKDKD